MEHIAAILLMVGCSGDLSQCTELPAPAAIFETAEECTAEKQPSLNALADRAERVFATCIPVDPALEEDYAAIVWQVHPDGTLEATVETQSSIQVASNDHNP